MREGSQQRAATGCERALEALAVCRRRHAADADVVCKHLLAAAGFCLIRTHLCPAEVEDLQACIGGRSATGEERRRSGGGVGDKRPRSQRRTSRRIPDAAARARSPDAISPFSLSAAPAGAITAAPRRCGGQLAALDACLVAASERQEERQQQSQAARAAGAR